MEIKAARNINSTLTAFTGSLLMVGLLGLPALVQAAAFTFKSNQAFPINVVVFVPCAAGGAGEFVNLSGELHDLFHVTIDNNDGFHVKFHENPQGVSGTGLTTGDKYQGTGVSQFQINGKVGFETTFVDNFRIIGPGPDNNFLVHDNFHITVNTNGTVTAFHDNFSVECK